MAYYIDELEKSVDETIQSQEGNCQNIPSNPAIFEDYVRQCIDDVLEYTKMKKQEVFQRIKNKIGSDMVDPFTELKSIEDKIEETEEKKTRYETAKNEYITAQTAQDYELFNKFFERTEQNNKSENQQEQEPNFPEYKNVLHTARVESQKIRDRIRNGNKNCMIITLICMLLDIFLLYQPFATGNEGGEVFTVLISMIAAFSIDSLPTMVGMMSSTIKNTQKMVALKKEAYLNTDSEQKELVQNRLWYFVTILITLLIFIGYILLRLILLAGGGDFNDGIQLFFVENMTAFQEALRRNDPSFTDAFSTLPPMATSLFCFLFSIFNTVVEADCIDAFNSKIRAQLKQAEKECEIQETNCITENNNNIEKKNQEITSVWRRYKKGTPPEDINAFKGEITVAACMMETKKYFGEYETFCNQARSCSERKINAIKAKFSCYCSEAKKILDMPVTEEEQDKMNYIWNPDGDQSEQTQDHIKALNRTISDTILTWTQTDIPEDTDKHE